MNYLKKYKLLMVGIVTFMFSIAVSVSIYAEKNNAAFSETCYYCDWGTGTCKVAGGQGWKICENGSSGSNTCALGGGDGCFDPGTPGEGD